MKEDPTRRGGGKEGRDISFGVTRYRLLCQETGAERMGLATPNLAKLLVEEEGFLKDLRIPEGQVHRIVAETKRKALLRWGSEITALGSLLEPDFKKQIDAEIEGGLRAEELAKKR